MNIPTEICDFMYEVLYSDGTPLGIKKSAFELINHHNLQMGSVSLYQAAGTIKIKGFQNGLSCDVPETIVRVIENHLQVNMKINAIKELRTATGWGLKEAKDCIDNWAACSNGVVEDLPF